MRSTKTNVTGKTNVAGPAPGIRLLRVILFILAFIGIAMVVRRTLVIEGIIASFTPGGGTPFDTGFAKHPVITFLHIIPGALFMILAPLHFIPRVRARYPVFLRRSERVLLFAAGIIGLSALCMPFIFLPIGGINEAAASIFYAVVFLLALGKVWQYFSAKEETLHREWLIRLVAIGLAIATIRPIIALFFAFSGQPPQVFFGTAFWIGFTLHLIFAEVWIHYTRKPVNQ